jgi:hypothetical protein
MSTTMEIKVKSGCGSVLSFPEEPVNGRVRWPLSCTSCGADAKDKADAFIARRQQSETGLRQAPPKRFAWFGRRKDELRLPVESAPNDAESIGVVSSAASGVSSGRMALGILACLVTGAASMVGWYFLTRWMGYEFGIVAWGIGGLVGVCARYCVPNGSFRMAGIAAACAATAIMGGAFLTLRHEAFQFIEQLLPAAYEEARDYAESALKLGSDEETREFLAEHRLGFIDTASAGANPIEAAQERHLSWMGWTLHGIGKDDRDRKPRLASLAKGVDPESITSADIAAFREKEVPALTAFLGGLPSQNEFEASLRRKIFSQISPKDMIIESVGPYTVLWLFLGIGTAFKLAHNKGLEY